MGEQDREKKKKKWPYCIGAIALVLVGVGIGIAISGFLAAPVSVRIEIPADTTEAEEEPEAEREPVILLDNPINFKALKTTNPDIYAWLRIPGTSLDAPISQSPDDDWYYLSHDSSGNEDPNGSLYTEMQNAKDFTDPVTVVYGHTLEEGYSFEPLHAFEDPAFFAEHGTIYIYQPERRLTYHIIAAYMFDDRHILNTADFSNPEELHDYFAMILKYESPICNVREGVTLSDDDQILQLSTCMREEELPDNRFVVTAVLVADEQTY